jgi:hypothetical protein
MKDAVCVLELDAYFENFDLVQTVGHEEAAVAILQGKVPYLKDVFR